MNKEFQKISSEELGLSFNFEIINHIQRTLEIRLSGMLRTLTYNKDFFGWFMEDLIYLLDKNRYQKRWDYGVIKIFNISSLKLSPEEQKVFLEQFPSVTNFDLIAA